MLNWDAVTTVILAVLSWIGSGLVMLGWMKAKMSAFDERLRVMEEEREKLVRRHEFNREQEDTRNRFSGVDRRLDRLGSK